MYATKRSQDEVANSHPVEVAEDSAYGGSETMSDAAPIVLQRQQNIAKQARRRSSGAAAETQLKYNNDSHEISRSVSEALKVANAFREQATDADWPMQVPMIQHVAKETRPGCNRTASSTESNKSAEKIDLRRQSLKRSSTTLSVNSPSKGADNSQVIENEDDVNVVLSTELNKQLQILRPEIMMAAHEENIIHTMNAVAVGEIMEQRFMQVQKHLRKLQVRVEDISSKVLVTGDLNAGKSTFCNALLRRRILPTDQQPCTEVFCEVLDARENEHKKEVHAVLHNVEYDRENAATFKRLEYTDLEEAVLSPADYASLKVYANDERPLSESLLHNGVVDIALIDAPGLNSDSLQTTAVYARQEEIDVIVFVVSAENHFTLSAKQFLWNASNEKAYLFIVVNRFDNIKDKDRCRRIILEQVQKLSPQTYADAAELVHFVSADSILEQPEPSRAEAFAELELQLRNFVLNKRSQSKLAPAKNFVGKFWSESASIASHNNDVATQEHAKLQAELLDASSRLTSVAKDGQVAVEEATRQNETSTEKVRTMSKAKILKASNSLADLKHEYAYSGVLDSYNFACNLRDQYLRAVLSATIDSEMLCRDITHKGVDVIRNIGLSHLGPDQYTLKPFNAKFMFSKKRDAIQRNLPVELHFLDFLDLANFEAVVGGSSLSAALVLYGGKTLGWSAMVDTSFRVLNTVGIERTPKLLGGVAVVALAGLCTYVVYQIPSALQKNLAKKVQDKIVALDYPNTNASRIANECRKVLQIPENELRLAFGSKVEAEQRAKLTIEKKLLTTTATIDFFKKQAAIIAKEERRLQHITL